MLIKHLNHSSGSGRGASQYLLQSHDAKGVERTEIKVLRGDPQLVGALADSLDFKHTYTHGVLAWAPEDSPTDEQIEQVVDDYEKLGFAGLDFDQYAFSAVLHREENGGVHVHTLAARVELSTGKSLNICPPKAMYLFNDIAKHHNFKNGWARPDDPKRTRDLRKRGGHYKDAEQVKKGLAVEPNTKEFITDYLTDLVSVGAVSNRAEILEKLEEIGEVTRANGKHYIGFKPEGEAKAIRLRGAIYEQEFDRKIATETARGVATNRSVDPEKSERARTKFEERCRNRAEFNRDRYKRPQPTPGRSTEGNGNKNKNQNRSDEHGSNAPNLDSTGDVVPLLGNFLFDRLGDEALVYGGDYRKKTYLELDKQRTEEARRLEELKSSDGLRGDADTLDRRTKSLAIKQRLGSANQGDKINERDRDIALKAIEQAKRIDGRLGRAIRSSKQSNERARKTYQFVRETCRKLGSRIKKFTTHIKLLAKSREEDRKQNRSLGR